MKTEIKEFAESVKIEIFQLENFCLRNNIEIYIDAITKAKTLDKRHFDYLVKVKIAKHLRKKFGSSWMVVFKFYAENNLTQVIIKEIILLERDSRQN